MGRRQRGATGLQLTGPGVQGHQAPGKTHQKSSQGGKGEGPWEASYPGFLSLPNPLVRKFQVKVDLIARRASVSTGAVRAAAITPVVPATEGYSLPVWGPEVCNPGCTSLAFPQGAGGRVLSASRALVAADSPRHSLLFAGPPQPPPPLSHVVSLPVCVPLLIGSPVILDEGSPSSSLASSQLK